MSDGLSIEIIRRLDDLERRYARTEVIESPGPLGNSGYFIAPYPFADGLTANANMLAANEVRAFRFVLPFPITISKVAFRVLALSAGQSGAMGIYNYDGTQRLIDTGPQSVAATGVISVTLGTSITLPFGVYWHAWTATDTTATYQGIQGNANILELFNANSVAVLAVSNQASVAGQLPTTLGTLTASTAKFAAIAKYQN